MTESDFLRVHQCLVFGKTKKAYHLLIWQSGLCYFAEIINPLSFLISKPSDFATKPA